MTFVVVGDDRVLEQVRKQLEKIVTVVRVDDISSQDYVERDLMLIKVKAPAGRSRTEIRELAEIFRGRIVDVGAEEVMIEISGQERKIEAFIDLMRPYGIVELVRTGRIAMVRGGKPATTSSRRASTTSTSKTKTSIRESLRADLGRLIYSQLTDSPPLYLALMPAKIYYDNDADLSVLKGKTIAILGYGSQGHAQAQNLRDSGCKVIIGQRPGGPNYDLAKSHGFKPVSVEEATKQADIVNILLPDEVQGDVYRQHIKPNLEAGQRADVLARLQHPLRPGRAAAGRRCRARRPEGPRPPGPQRVREAAAACRA